MSVIGCVVGAMSGGKGNIDDDVVEAEEVVEEKMEVLNMDDEELWDWGQF